ncbi:MAG: hypothetical protein ABIK62_06810, partial [candidate division WOR-3 bacterium]
RPHEALGMKVPAEVYRPSERKLYDVLAYVYPLDFERRCVDAEGCIFLHGESVYLSAALVKQDVGLELVSNNCWRVWFCDLAVAELVWDGTCLKRRPVTETGLTAPLDCHPCPDNKVLPMS